MIDIHCHILPGLDDGPQDPGESLAMARRALKDGVNTIVATPHTLDGLYVNSRSVIAGAAESLRAALIREKIDLRICTGADVHLCPNLLERVEEGTATTIDENGKYLLLELPPMNIPDRLKNEIFSLKINGITPIITHPERHPAMQRDLGILHELVSMGALAQVTAMSITGEFGLPVMACARAMLDLRLIHVIASDAHSAESRPPVLSRAVEESAEILGSQEEAEDMVLRTPAAILEGAPVEAAAPRPVKKKMRS
jgi:protein-tyrosine phosphatase